MYTGKESSYRGRKIRIAGREEEQKTAESQHNNAPVVNYQTRLEAKEKVIRSIQRNASVFSYNNMNMMCIYGNNSDEILREAIEDVKHSIYGNFLVLPKSKLTSAENDDEFTLFINALGHFLRNTKICGLSEYFTSWGIGRFILFSSKLKKTNDPELKGEICKELVLTIKKDCFREFHIGLVWNVEIDTNDFDHNPLKNLFQIASENLLIIVTSKKTLDYEIDLFSENIIQTD